VVALVPATAIVGDETPPAAAVAPPNFAADVLPVLNRRCVECHGVSKKSGGLRLDSYAALMAGSRKGPVVAPGKSGESKLIAMVQAGAEDKETKRMPPPEAGEPLKAEEIALLKRWIDAGAARPAKTSEERAKVELRGLPARFRPILAVVGDAAGSRVAAAWGAKVVVQPLEPGTSAPVALEGHGDLVQALSFSPDGKLLAASGFREVILWSTESWHEARRLGPHADRVLALAFSADGALLAAAGGEPSASGELKLWEVESGRLVKTFTDIHSDTIFSVDFSRDGKRLATGGADRIAAVVEIESGKRALALEGHTHHVLAVRFSPDGKRLYSASADAKIKSWNLEDGSKIKDWGGHGKAVTALDISPDGGLIVSASGDRTVRIWNPDGNQQRSHGEAEDYLYDTAFFGSGKLIVAGGRDQKVRVYAAGENKLIRTFEAPASP
jgi:hypothetical protein